MKNVDKIIFNALASRRGVGLPEVGALTVIHTPAAMTDRRVTAPINEVAFSREWPEGTVSVIDLITALGVESGDAAANYAAWLAQAHTNEGVNIEGAGIIRGGAFYTAANLERQLNPAGAKSGKKGSSKSERAWWILIVVFILILAVCWSLWWYHKNGGTFCPKDGDRKQTATEQVGASQSSAGETQPDTDTAADTEKTAGADNNAAASAGSAQVDQNTPASQPAVSAVAAGGDVYHVVGGVFSTDENAEKYIKLFKGAYPNAATQKVAYKNDKILVSVFSSASETEATNRRNRLADELYSPDLWVYRQAGGK